MDNMKILRPLGRTGIMVTPIGLGCWQFSKQNNMAGRFWPSLEDDLIEKVVALSIEGGINWFDTAEVYGNGASEKALSKALKASVKKPGDVVIATKWWPVKVLLKELSVKYSVTPSQVALNWLIQYNGDTVVAIPGATKEIHVKENCGATSFRLTDEDMLRLDNVSSIFK